MRVFSVLVLFVCSASAFSVPLAARSSPLLLRSTPRASNLHVRDSSAAVMYGGGGPFGPGPDPFGRPSGSPRLGGGGGGFDPRDLLGPVIFAALLFSGVLGWLFNGLLFLTLLPLIAVPLFQWYVSANLVEGTCPECAAPAQVLKGQRGFCGYCGSTFSSELSGSMFLREGGKASEDGVVEVDVFVD